MRRSQTAAFGEDHQEGQNRTCGLRVLGLLLIIGITAFICDIADFRPLFSTFAVIGGIIRGASAALAQEPLLGRQLTRWDEAAMLIAAGLFAHVMSFVVI